MDLTNSSEKDDGARSSLSRLQFAFVLSFQIIFPSFTIGLAAWLIEGVQLTTGKEIYRRVFDRRGRGVEKAEMTRTTEIIIIVRVALGAAERLRARPALI